MKYYISDLHFFHDKVIMYDNRKFKSVEEMNTTLINNWNSRVTDEDDVYILGDVSWCKDPGENIALLRGLRGRKHLIYGNHDKAMKVVNKQSDVFASVNDYLQVSDTGCGCVVMSHYPILFWNCQFRDSIHLYGHVHNSHQYNIFETALANVRDLQAIPMRAYNVGCMMPWMNYTPRTLSEIIEGYNKVNRRVEMKKIAAAAVRAYDEEKSQHITVDGYNHSACYEALAFGYNIYQFNPGSYRFKEGFRLTDGSFVDRLEATRIAKAKGQLKKDYEAIDDETPLNSYMVNYHYESEADV